MPDSFGQASTRIRHTSSVVFYRWGKNVGNELDNLYWLSSFYAGSGDKEKALATLQKSFDLGYRDFPAINANSAFSSLRVDPRFQHLLHRFSQ
jgi:hypothetical protein